MNSENIQHQAGRVPGNIFLFTLSTCIWCRKTKQLLQELEIAFDFVELDRLEGTEREEALAELEKWNADRSFPTMVIEGARSIIGFQEAEIREAVGQ
ncbi:glutaredoxin [Hydrogenispora ethanolica]|uniref:Glutaredoxin n=1 Tax=Hydrogenispora ethanolica TaxID=1082276 RepID=A0A4R1RTE1_HYDET|nr:glutaredoxin family protein [Hydrogenispora ethanolica]TCL69330.1 glutaredoxin [Hydrogenispora ethanolica]